MSTINQLWFIVDTPIRSEHYNNAAGELTYFRSKQKNWESAEDQEAEVRKKKEENLKQQENIQEEEDQI